jgi:hypothetical protein
MKSISLDNFNGANYQIVKKIYVPATFGYFNLPLFAIYENPKDFPNKYVVRLWEINRQLGKTIATRYCVVKDTLEECRKALPPGLYRIGRESSDDPIIIESWI